MTNDHKLKIRPVGVITKASPTAFEFSQDAESIRMCVADAATQLTLNLPPPTADGQWQEIRARRMRLLMRVRGSWVTMRNAFWDGKPIVEGFGIVTEDDAEKPVNHNRDIALQEDLVRFMKEYAPAMDKFVIAAYASRPVDLREVNEFLSIGGYTLAERSVMIRKVAETSRTSISEVLKKQLTVTAK